MKSSDGKSGINWQIHGIPTDIPSAEAAICRSRLLRAVTELEPWIDRLNSDFAISIGEEATLTKLYNRPESKKNENEELFDTSKRAEQYQSYPPFYTFDHLIVPTEVKENLLSAVELLKVEKIVFDDWGLREIEPFPRTALNFYGPPGTGKTLAAHALAHFLNRPILVASYAEIESKFHGDGPKNVKAIFHAAERDKAVLFIDEADSLLSKRLLNVTQGSEQAINSMRSQLLICLEQFTGISIFSTNLVENYDKAFETRIRHVCFSMPDKECRYRIWRRHLVEKLPLSEDINLEQLASDVENVCGRDIKNAVIDAAVRAAREERTHVTMNDLLCSITRITQERSSVSEGYRPLNQDEFIEVQGKVQRMLRDNDDAEQIAAADRQGIVNQAEQSTETP
ncbi:ATP-binding protein [Myxococcota bacterium]|nr:ATP-binding protein [Myxococcota bacterium]